MQFSKHLGSRGAIGIKAHATLTATIDTQYPLSALKKEP
jgi:hypothetical protein